MSIICKGSGPRKAVQDVDGVMVECPSTPAPLGGTHVAGLVRLECLEKGGYEFGAPV